MKPDRDVVLGDRYALRRRIAVGGMGEVWEATDTVLDRAVAVKLLKAQYRSAPTFLARFRSEARHAGGLSHVGIASVYDYGETDDAAYLVMELVPGRPLSEVIADEPDLPDLVKLSVLAQTAEALQAAHDAGVVHRDVKPGNLILRPDGTVKVTDFGIARAFAGASLTETGQIVGTAAYISPEQATGADVTPASDVYSWGVVAYELFAGRLPFERDSAVALAHAHVFDLPPPLPDRVPPGVATMIGAALEKDPWKRPVSAAAAAWRARAEMAAIPGAPGTASSSGAASLAPTTPMPLTAWSSPPLVPSAPELRTTTPAADRPADEDVLVPLAVPTGNSVATRVGPPTMVSVPGTTSVPAERHPAPAPAAAPSPAEPDRTLLSVAPRRRVSPVVLAFVAVVSIGAALVWALGAGSGDDRDAAPPPASVDTATASSIAAPATTPAAAPVTTAASTTPAPAGSTAPTAPTESTTPVATVPPATAAPTAVPTTAAPAPVVPAGPAPPPGRDRVDDAEAIAFVVDYYQRLAAGEYETTWALLSDDFRTARDLTFERYVDYWRNTSIEIDDLRIQNGGGRGTARVRFTARYTTATGVVEETDEITLRRTPDGRRVITEQRVV